MPLGTSTEKSIDVKGGSHKGLRQGVRQRLAVFVLDSEHSGVEVDDTANVEDRVAGPPDRESFTNRKRDHLTNACRRKELYLGLRRRRRPMHTPRLGYGTRTRIARAREGVINTAALQRVLDPLPSRRKIASRD
jgi:hypothetical protein